jgi:hypothetical protein
MTIEEADEQLTRLIAAIEGAMPDIVQEVGISTVSVVTARIMEEGLPGKKYSENKLPPFYFYDKELNAGGRNLLKESDSKALRAALRSVGTVKKNSRVDNKDTDGISYKEWRNANGLQTEVVDLTFTGFMLKSLKKVEAKQLGPYKWLALVSPIDKESAIKLELNYKRYGDFLTPTEKEEKDALDIVEGKILDIIYKFFPT